MAQQNQLSRYGAISRVIPGLAPGSKVFIVADSDDTTVGPDNLAANFPPDEEGVVRVFTTIQSAQNAARENNGDVVLVSPGYNLAHSRADSWTTAGVQIRGMGEGFNRPTLTYNDTAASVDLTANGILVDNIKFVSSVSGCRLALDMSVDVEGQIVRNCEFGFDATGDDFITSIRLGSKRSLVENNAILMETDTTGPRAGISFVFGDPDFSVIQNNYITGQFDTVSDTNNSHGAIVQDSIADTGDTQLNGLLIKGNVIQSGDTTAARLIAFSDGCVNRGMVVGNLMSTMDSATADTTQVVVDASLWLHNYLKRGDTEEKLVADSFVIAN